MRSLFKCSDCGAHFKGTHRSCTVCGSAAGDTERDTCRRCGRRLVESAHQSCSKCGSENVTRISTGDA